MTATHRSSVASADTSGGARADGEARQAQRLFGLDATTCDEVLAGLLQSGFLSLTVDGMFALTQAGDRVAPAESAFAFGKRLAPRPAPAGS